MNEQKTDFQQQELAFEKNIFRLRLRYQDTPAGLKDPVRIADEEQRLRLMDRRLQSRTDQAETITGLYSFPDEPFVGRKQELELLHRRFADGSHIQLISGLGGIGKTSLAGAYAARYGSEYDEVLEFPANPSIYKNLSDDQILLIRDMDYSSGEYRSRKEFFARRFERLKQLCGEKKVLLILDDVRDLRDPNLAELLQFPADLLITSRLHNSRFSGLTDQPVPEISLGVLSDPEIEAMAELLAGDKMTGRTREYFSNIRARYRSHTLVMKIWLQSARADTVFFSTGFSEQLLYKSHLKGVEWKALRFLAVLPENGIPRSWFLKVTGLPESTIDRLSDYSLVTRFQGKTGQPYLSLHPLIREAIIYDTDPTVENCRTLLYGIAKDVKNAWNAPRELNRQKEYVILHLLEIFPDPKPWMADVFDSFVTFLWIQNYFTEAEQYSLKLFSVVSEYYGEPHQQTGAMALRTAAVYRHNMRRKRAETWYRRGYENLNACRPFNYRYSALLASACSKMAQCCRFSKDYDQAERYLRQGLSVLAGDHMQASDPENLLPEIYLHRQLAEVFLEDQKEAAAEKHRRIMHQTMHRYLEQTFAEEPLESELRETDIRFLIHRQKYTEAIPLLEQNADICSRYRGPHHENTLRVQETLADCLLQCKDAAGAKRLYLQILQDLTQYFPLEESWQRQVREKAAPLVGI